MCLKMKRSSIEGFVGEEKERVSSANVVGILDTQSQQAIVSQ